MRGRAMHDLDASREHTQVHMHMHAHDMHAQLYSPEVS